VKLDIIDKAGAWFAYNNEKLGQGRENVKQKFKDDPALALEVENKIKEALGISGMLEMDPRELDEVDV
jgi:recombination protein RecA